MDFLKHKKKEAKEDLPPPPPKDDTSLRQLKVLEERINNLDRKTEVIENNILIINKRQNVEIKTLTAKNLDLEKDISLIKKRVTEIVHDLKNAAKKEDLEVMRKYLDLWQPLNFVTHKEVDELVEEKINNNAA